MDGRNIELKLLRCLLALVEESNVTRAAERVNLSQPRMSNALRRLRQITNDPLLVRAGQRMVPTARAIDIANQVRQNLEEIDRILWAQDVFEPATSRRTFLIMMSGYTSVLLLPPVLQEVRKVAPNVEISVLQMTHDHLQKLMEEGQCDLAFGYFSDLHPNLRISNCFEDKPVSIVSTTYFPADNPLDLSSFLAGAHVGLGDPAGDMSTLDVVCDRELQALGYRRNIVARVPSPYAVARLVAVTDLIGILPQRLAIDYAQHLPLRLSPIPLTQPAFNVSMVWHERSHKDDGHNWLRSLFRQVASRRLNPPDGLEMN